MRSLWNDRDAAACESELSLRAYSSRLLGRDPALVLHGGGNTSVKLDARDVFGQDVPTLYVKGSGWDLATISEAGFTPVRLDPLIALSRLRRLSDPQMVNELLALRLDATAPAPSVETILHAILPYRYVDHTHADAVLAITNTRDGRRRIEDLYGDSVVVVPYVMPGFDLARRCARDFPRLAGPRTVGMILMNHGVFSFGQTASESYERMIALVGAAERYLRRHRAWQVPRMRGPRRAADPTALATLRRNLSHAAGGPVVLAGSDAPAVAAFVTRADLPAVAGRGPATPDHCIRTKRLPMVGRDVDAYARRYRRYFERNARRARVPITMLDPAPRIVLDRQFGLRAAGRSVRDARIAADLYEHTVEVIARAEALGGYRALPERDIFAVEYWDLEQAKLRRGGGAPVFAGEVAVVTGGASGIGRATVEALLAGGAAVAVLDRDPAVLMRWQRPDCLPLVGDAADTRAVERALRATVERFGGLDIAVLNAGVFPPASAIAAQSQDGWQRAMDVNATAGLALLRAAHPFLRLAPRGGRVVVVGSKNVPAPGPGAAAYSASKAALAQLARVAALEWGADGIRVNLVHPDAVFDTGLWTPALIAERAARYGLSVEAYKTRNLLGAEVRSRDVAELICALLGPAFSRTTGAQIPIDGGNDRVV